MNTPQIIGLCFSCFVLGFLTYASISIAVARERKPRKEERWEIIDPCEPLKRQKGETTRAFIERTMEEVKKGRLTPNAARMSLGLKIIDPKADGFRVLNECATCKHCARKGWGGPCQDCYNHDEWEPRE